MRFFLISLFSLLFYLTSASQENGGEEVFISNACGVTKIIPRRLLATCTAPRDEIRQLIKDMTFITGQKSLSLYIGSTTSPHVPYAIAGIDTHGRPCILVNERTLSHYPVYSKFALLSHELGHINYRHIDQPLDTTKELQADYYAGFWSSKVKTPNQYFNEVLEPFSHLGEDAQHPPYGRREKEIRMGWEEAGRPLTFFAENRNNKPLSVLLKDSVDVLLVITPDIKKRLFRASKLLHKITLNVVSKSIRIPNDSLYARMNYVSYVIKDDDETFKEPYWTLDSTFRQTNFEYTLRKVYDTFRIVTVILFSDDSVLSIPKTFDLPGILSPGSKQQGK